MNGQKEVATKNIALDDPELKAEIGDAYLSKLDEEVQRLLTLVWKHFYSISLI